MNRNIDNIKVELNILDSLVGSKDIEKDFEDILGKYPEVLKCIPLLLAVRNNEINNFRLSQMHRYLLSIHGLCIKYFDDNIHKYKVTDKMRLFGSVT